MPLSPEQMRFFHRFGYVVARGLFDTRETAAIVDGFERTMAMCGVDRLGDGSRRGILGPIQHRPEMNAILDHPRFIDLAESAFGGEFNYACGDGNFYSGDTNWHPDGNWGEVFACKALFYLDPLTRGTGALRVIPGSHDPTHALRQPGGPGHNNIAKAMEECAVAGRDFPGAEAVETQAGDVIIFNHDLFHASFGGGKRRRMFTMNLTRRCRTPRDFELLRKYVSIHSPGGYKLPIGGMYFRPIWDGASPHERRARLEQCRTVHDELFPQFMGEQTHREQLENMMRVMYPEAVVAAA